MKSLITNPPHPGETIEGLWLEPVTLTRSQLAEHIGVPLAELSRFFDGHTRLTADLAARLAKALGTDRDLLLGFQLSYDLAQVSEEEVDRIPPLKLVLRDEDEQADEAA